jgi:uncharacterized protein
MRIIEILQQPWPWYVSGMVISAVMFLLIFFGKAFGFSSNLRTICAACGAGKLSSFFNYNWKDGLWNIVFLAGSVLGGFVAYKFLNNGQPVQIAAATISDIQKLGIAAPAGLQPKELFSIEALFTLKGFSLLALGGLLIGFGTRYAGGCTSGHAISGLSNLQLPSLVAVIGFFIGGMV